MPSTFPEISRYLRLNSEARIFRLNLFLQARAGGIPRGEIRDFVRDLITGFGALKSGTSWPLMTNDTERAQLVWNLCENVASAQKFQFRPLAGCDAHSLAADAEVLTVMSSADFSAYYVDAKEFLKRSRVPTDDKVDHRTFVLHLESQWNNAGGPTFLQAELLRGTLKPGRLRGRMPFFWISSPQAERLSMAAADLRDLLGLVHIADPDAWLLEIALNAAAVQQYAGSRGSGGATRAYLLRPRTLGARPGTRFRAVTPAEAARQAASRQPALKSCGTTVNLAQLAAQGPSIDGWPELICVEVPWDDTDETRSEAWWDRYKPSLRIVGDVKAKPRGHTPTIDDDAAYERRLRHDFGAAFGLRHR